MGRRSGDHRDEPPALIEVDFSPRAAADIDEAVARYRKVSIELASDYLDEIAATEDRLRRGSAHVRPALGVDPSVGVSRVLMKRFPHVLYMVQRPYGWYVIAVGHGHRRPGHWRPRLPR